MRAAVFEALVWGCLTTSACQSPPAPTSEVVVFDSGELLLQGVLWKPAGPGPFPAVLFNHGSGRDYSEQIAALGPLFTGRGYAFFMPYRRGHGLSAEQAEWIGSQLDKAEAAGGQTLWSQVMTQQLRGPHLADQLAARGGRPTGGEDVVYDQDPRIGDQRVRVDFECVRPVLQRVRDRAGLARQLARLADEHQPDTELVG